MIGWRRLGWLDFVPDALAGLVVLLAGRWEIPRTALPLKYVAGVRTMDPDRTWLYVIVLAMALAVGLSRRLPSASLVLLALVAAIHLEAHAVFLVVEVAVCAVMFGAARWGRAATVVLALVFVVVAGLLGLVVLSTDYFGPVVEFLPAAAAQSIESSSRTWRVVAVAAGGVLLVVPWLLGLVLRLLARAISARDAAREAERETERAHRETAQIREIARLREGQAQLARDVHDVVGHSLAVILAQAESGQYAPDAEQLKRTMATIADSARVSLQDVRQVLRDGEARPGDLEQLIDGVRAAGHDVTTTVTGQPQPLPPELETVAYRVLQEMLTNALRHGRREGTVEVRMDWNEMLTVRTSNPAADPVQSDGGAGAGLDGMRRRVSGVGGTLTVEPGDPFVVTARIPVRPR